MYAGDIIRFFSKKVTVFSVRAESAKRSRTCSRPKRTGRGLLKAGTHWSEQTRRAYSYESFCPVRARFVDYVGLVSVVFGSVKTKKIASKRLRLAVRKNVAATPINVCPASLRDSVARRGRPTRTRRTDLRAGPSQDCGCPDRVKECPRPTGDQPAPLYSLFLRRHRLSMR